MKFTEIIDKISWKYLLLIAFFIVFLFSMIFYFFSMYSPENGLFSKSKITYFLTIYFSAITFTSLEYSDISPIGISRLLFLIEGIFGLIFLSIFIAKIISERNNRMINKIYSFEYLNFLNIHKKRLSEHRQILPEIVKQIKKDPKGPNIKKDIKYHFGSSRTGVLRHIGSTFRTIYNFLDKEKKQKEYFIEEVDVYWMQGLIHSVFVTIKSINKSFLELNDSKVKWKNGSTKNLMNFIYSSANSLTNWLLENYPDEEIKEKSKKIKKEFAQVKKVYFTQSS